MAKYGQKAKKKVGRAMHKRKRGTLKSGSGRKVTSKKQAVAIGLAEARREGGKVPAKKTARKKSAKKKSPSRKTSRKTSSRKSTKKKSSRKSTRRSSSKK